MCVGRSAVGLCCSGVGDESVRAQGTGVGSGLLFRVFDARADRWGVSFDVGLELTSRARSEKKFKVFREQLIALELEDLI